MPKPHDLGPLLTIAEEELLRPARRREDRDVLVLRIEIEAQRREVARLMAIVGRGEYRATNSGPATTHVIDPDKVLLSARDLRRVLGVSSGTIYRWISESKFPPQVHLGSLARWKKADVDSWLQEVDTQRKQDAIVSGRPQTVQRVRGGRSRWAPTTAGTPLVTEGHVRNWEPQPTPIRGTDWRLPPSSPEPVSPDHPDYAIPRYRLQEAVKYVGLPWSRQWDLLEIPHGRTKAMHYCFAQSDLDHFKAALPATRRRRPHAEEQAKSADGRNAPDES